VHSVQQPWRPAGRASSRRNPPRHHQSRLRETSSDRSRGSIVIGISVPFFVQEVPGRHKLQRHLPVSGELQDHRMRRGFRSARRFRSSSCPERSGDENRRCTFEAARWIVCRWRKSCRQGRMFHGDFPGLRCRPKSPPGQPPASSPPAPGHQSCASIRSLGKSAHRSEPLLRVLRASR
jgi:hypothetical protein